MIRRILLALGGTPFSEVALRRAIELAKLHDAQITAVPIVDSDYWKASIYRTNLSATAAVRLLETRPWELAEQRVRQIITDFEHQCECQEIPHTVLEPGGDPIHMLITQSRQHDLVIFGLRGLFDFTVVPDPAGTVARLVREGVSPMIAAAPTYRDIRRVLIAYSGSTASANAMKQFIQMALWPDATIHITCFDKDDPQATSHLKEALAYCHAHGLNPTTSHERGPEPEGICSYVQENGIDLVVMGDSFEHLLIRGVLGDTAMDVLRKIERPLFLSH